MREKESEGEGEGGRRREGEGGGGGGFRKVWSGRGMKRSRTSFSHTFRPFLPSHFSQLALPPPPLPPLQVDEQDHRGDRVRVRALGEPRSSGQELIYRHLLPPRGVSPPHPAPGGYGPRCP